MGWDAMGRDHMGWNQIKWDDMALGGTEIRWGRMACIYHTRNMRHVV